MSEVIDYKLFPCADHSYLIFQHKKNSETESETVKQLVVIFSQRFSTNLLFSRRRYSGKNAIIF